jgi:hypothetical protein
MDGNRKLPGEITLDYCIEMGSVLPVVPNPQRKKTTKDQREGEYA